jgi:hypothetical protein
MKKKNHSRPIRSKLSVLRQLCNLIPTHLVIQIARATGADIKARTFSCWSHVVSMLFAQLTHAIGLNDVCDSLGLFSGPLSAIRGVTAPSRNNLSHANKVRPADMAEKLFWAVLHHSRQTPGFGGSRQRLPRGFKASIHVVDSTTIELVASCMDWAKHRRRKAAAKCHLRLDLQSYLPACIIIDTAREADAKRAREVCAGLKDGEIVIFDKAYIDLVHLYQLEQRGVSWVTRAKADMKYRVVKRRLKKPAGKTLSDEEVVFTGEVSFRRYPARLRRVVALVEIDGVEQEMVFLTNNLSWAPSSVAGLYKNRWGIETFFKQIKQTMQLADFLGNSANAVRWQVWTALLTYLLLRYQSFLSKWGSSFVRLWAVVRSALWVKLDVVSLLKSYGTAGGDFRLLGQPEQAYLPGFRPQAMG